MGVGHSAATHHSGSYYPIFTNIPGFRVAVPTTPADAKGLLKTAIRSDDPVVFMEHRSLLQTRGPVPDGEHLVPVRPRGRRAGGVGRDGGRHRGHGAARPGRRRRAGPGGRLRRGHRPRTLAPLDLDTILESVHKTGRLLIADESYGPCGIGAEIAAQVADRGFDDLDAPIRRLNGLHTPIPYSPPLEKAVVPDVDAVVRAIRDLRAE